MPGLAESRGEVVDALLGHYGPSPPPGGEAEGGEGRFEALARVAIGLIADPRATAATLAALRGAGLLQAEALAQASPAEVEDVLKGARIRLPIKALGPLRKLAARASEGGWGDDDGDLPSTEALREEWRSINGIGPASADALLLFAIGRPAYPVDRATYRILVRHGWIDPTADHDEARSVAEGLAPDDPATLARVVPAMARLARDFCKAGRPRCEACPLRPWLPEDGPRESD